MVPKTAAELRLQGFEVFDDWHAAGPEADDYWQKYETGKGNDLKQALKGYAAKHVFAFDQRHLNRADIGVLVLPAGKSGHLELGYLCGQGKKCYVLFDKEPDRFDVMYQFATGGVFYTLKELMVALEQDYPNEDIRERVDEGSGASTSRSPYTVGSWPRSDKHVVK